MPEHRPDFPREKNLCFLMLPSETKNIGLWNVKLASPNPTNPPLSYFVAVFSDETYFYYRLWRSQPKRDPNSPDTSSELVFNKKTKTLETNTQSIFNDAEFFAILHVFTSTAVNLPFFRLDISDPVLMPMRDLFEKVWKLPKHKHFENVFIVENVEDFVENKFKKVPGCIVGCTFLN
jgi:hypothetical protein